MPSPCSLSRVSIALSTLIACVFVSPYRAREPAGALVSATDGTVPDVQTTAALAGMATVLEIGPRPPVNTTLEGAACPSAVSETVARIAMVERKRANISTSCQGWGSSGKMPSAHAQRQPVRAAVHPVFV